MHNNAVAALVASRMRQAAPTERHMSKLIDDAPISEQGRGGEGDAEAGSVVGEAVMI